MSMALGPSRPCLQLLWPYSVVIQNLWYFQGGAELKGMALSLSSVWTGAPAYHQYHCSWVPLGMAASPMPIQNVSLQRGFTSWAYLSWGVRILAYEECINWAVQGEEVLHLPSLDLISQLTLKCLTLGLILRSRNCRQSAISNAFLSPHLLVYISET